MLAPLSFAPPLLVQSSRSTFLPKPNSVLKSTLPSRPRYSSFNQSIRASITPPDNPDDISVVADTDAHERNRRRNKLSTSVEIPVPPEPTVVSVEFAPGKTAYFETGHVARQAAGAVNVRLGETLVYCTACADAKPSPTVDFLPLRVDYAEKFSSQGRTSGSYIKREGRPSEREILTSRLIDRSLRPMFADGYYNDVQVLASVFSYDGVHPADGISICAASASLHVSRIPLVQPVAGVRVSYIDDQFIVEPSVEQARNSRSELIVAGTEENILMIEGYCKFIPEEQIIQAVRVAHQSIKKLCRAISTLREKFGSEKDLSSIRLVPDSLSEQMESLSSGLDEALAVIGKKEREKRVDEVKERIFGPLKPPRELYITDPDRAEEQFTQLRIAWKELVSSRMRRRIVDENIRPDGRGVRTVRPITIQPSPLPRAHGSALFTRGETQTLTVTTLGGDDMAQRFETLDGEGASRFYLQYSFPPSSVGETGRIGAPGRREIGHGKLAERALLACVPKKNSFPYVMRVESNILESNGSSSMASVCGGCLALLDAGVPLECSVAGIAMGLVLGDKKEFGEERTVDERAVVLTDILGLEDALGLCDAKFAGNREGLSALQLDVKLRGISIELLERILMQAKEGRIHILDCMDAVMPKARSELPASVPKVQCFQISPRRIGDVIGPGGKRIRSIIEECGGENMLQISIGNDGTVSVSSSDDEMLDKAQSVIESLAVDLKVGQVLKCEISKILPFGAFVKISEGKEGWLHISELETKRTNVVEDVCKVGDVMELKVIEIGRGGQVRLSRRALQSNSKAMASVADKSGATASAICNDVANADAPSATGTDDGQVNKSTAEGGESKG